MGIRRIVSAVCLVLAASTALHAADDAAAPAWQRHENALLGPSRAVAFAYAPTVGRWMAIGYQHPPGTAARKPKTYDEVAFDPAEGRWENWYPPGKAWGEKFGEAAAPGWKGEKGGFKDVEGNTRPNWPAWYWLLGAGRNNCWDPDGKRFLFYIDGNTFSYDPAARTWTDLAAAGDPQSLLAKSRMLWGSICFDEANKRIVLFGGGNAQTPRGDVGTWTYTPATNTWAQLDIAVQPPARANSALVYDPVNKRVVLFGGDRLDRLQSDTWTFDGSKWEQRSPSVGPSPRAGHAMLWLPKTKKVLLLGGYGYTSSTDYYGDPSRGLPLEAWTYDVAADRWDLVRRIEPAKKGEPATSPTSPGKYFLQAAVDPDDRVAVLDANRTLWTLSGASFAPDAVGTAAHGVKPAAVSRRTGSYDPAWYADVPPADPAKVEADLAAIPVNRWVRRNPPKQPKHNSDWGSAVYAVDTDQIIRFSGGHAAYSGTAPHIYDIKTDRWSLPFAPEIPVEFTYGNDGVPGEWSFGGNPWMTGHTYKALGYDPNLKGMIFGPHKNSYLFDPRAGKWSRFESANPYQCSFYTVSLIPTPKGLVAWANGAGGPFWRLDAADRTWKPLPVKGKPFGPICDNAGMAYDAKRDRMIGFACKGKTDTAMFAYDLSTGEATPIEAAGAAKVQDAARAAGAKGHFEFRESVYIPEMDMVMNGATGLFYDCAKNTWLKATIPSDAPDVTKHASFNLGVMYDSRRKLVWAVDTNFNLFVLRLEPAALNLEAL